MPADHILRARNVRRAFGGLVAVDVAEVAFERGKVTALIGPNGAGKTTFFNVLTGFDRADRGSWELISVDGTTTSLRKEPAYRVARHGVVRTFQLTKALAKMSVIDNVTLAAPGQRGEHLWSSLLPASWRKQERDNRDRAMSILERFSLAEKAIDYAGTLSGGQRKLLELARALMAQPQLLMLDEPMAGVNPALAQRLLAHIKNLRAEGMSVVFVEHDMDAVRDISDHVIVMAQGSVIATGTIDEIATDPVVIDAYLGAHHGRPLVIEPEPEA